MERFPPMKEIQVVNGMPITPELKKKLWPIQKPEDFDSEGRSKVKPSLTPHHTDGRTLWRDGMMISLNKFGPAKFLKIAFGPDDYSTLGAEEMKLLAHLITTGSTHGYQ